MIRSLTPTVKPRPEPGHQHLNPMRQSFTVSSSLRPIAFTTLALSASAVAWGLMGPLPSISIGSDLNSLGNPFVQPQDPAFSGGGRDQTLQLSLIHI